MTQVVVSVVVASLLGSLHCAGMCGGFVAFYSASDTSERQHWLAHAAYNLGRLLTYTVVGVFAGALGGVANVAGVSLGFGKLAALASGVLMLAWGATRLLDIAGVRLPRSRLMARVPAAVSARLSALVSSARERPPAARALTLGLASALLPCGWLYAFAVAAAGTGSALWGGVVMVAFWSGTLPIMLGMGVGIQRLSGRLRAYIPTLSALLLIVIGVASLFGRLRLDHVVRAQTTQLDQTLHAGSAPASGEAPCCHGK